jgi:hypothetical protein
VPDKLEVLTGPGLVARYDEVAVWAGPQASPALQVHLVNEAQRTSRGPNGGDQLASSLIAILQRGDPEPQAPFAVVGPGANGLTLFLHGPVQAWDSGRWLAPQPVPGWIVTSIGRPWPLIILPYGASPPPQSQQGNPMDLVAGAVPGAGFVMLRPPVAGGQGATAPQATAAPQPAPAGYDAPVGSAAGGAAIGAMAAGDPGGPGTGGPGGIGLSAGGAGTGSADLAGAAALGAAAGMAAGATTFGEPGTQQTGTQQAGPAAQPQTEVAALSGAAVVAPDISTTAPGGTAVDLRSVFGAGRPPLALATAAALSYVPGQPEVVGVRCELGHFNHPRVSNCLRCGRPVPPGAPQVNGPRPPVGVLLADDGSVWALRRGCLIGAEPSSAPEVQSGAVDAIVMKAGASHAMGPVQTELQLRDWSTYLVDRGAEGGSWVQGPAAQDWEQLGRNEQRELANGSHLSCGGRVLTYLSAWPL